MLIKRLTDDTDEVSVKRHAQTFCDAASPKHVGSPFATLYTRWALGKPGVDTIYAELALYTESNALENHGAVLMPTGRAFLSSMFSLKVLNVLLRERERVRAAVPARVRRAAVAGDRHM